MIFYIGSHNLTKGAWGSVSKNSKYFIKVDKLTISNTELGVLFLNFNKEFLLNWLPFKYPPNRYSINDVPYTNMQ